MPFILKKLQCKEVTTSDIASISIKSFQANEDDLKMHRLARLTKHSIATKTALILPIFFTIPTLSYAKIVTGIDETAQLPFWELNQSNLHIRLVQRLPDQTRGFFEARGFKKADAELLAQACIFQTIFKNNAKKDSDVLLKYDISQWRVMHNNKTTTMGLREEWDKTWQKNKVPKSSRIAFEWALIPTRQQYQAQDYNWGMTVYGLPPSSKFNLLLKWKENGKAMQHTIKNMECAADIHPDPEDPFAK